MSDPLDDQYKQPDWFDRSKLRKAQYAHGYTGWVIDLGDGTCRFANEPLLGCDDDDNPRKDEINANRPHWGDRVRLIQQPGGFPMVDANEVLERYDPAHDAIKESTNG